MFNKYTITSFLLMFAAIYIFYQPNFGSRTGNGEVITEARDLTDFNRIDIAGIGEAVVTLGDTFQVDVTAEANLIEFVRTEVRGDELRIEIEGPLFGSIQPTEPITYTITLPVLEAIELSGNTTLQATAISTEDDFKVDQSGSTVVTLAGLVADEVEIDLSGASTLEFERLEAAELDVDLSGASVMTVSAGTVATQRVDLSGSANYNAAELATQETRGDASGSSTATVQVHEALDVDVSGSARVSYSGDYGTGTLSRN